MKLILWLVSVAVALAGRKEELLEKAWTPSKEIEPYLLPVRLT